MRLEPSRLRAAEWVIGIASAVLLVDMFLLPWYEVALTHNGLIASFPASALDGWHSLTLLRYLILLTALVGLAIWWFQATRESPAVPVILTVLEMIPSGLLLLTLIWRILIDNPDIHGEPSQNVEAKLGAYLGLILAAAILLGTYRSLRQDGVSSDIGSRTIERLSLDAGIAAPPR
ncbi:MAG: hypothetical protein ACLP8S_31320 [Solirubrobacteraceae bacterium]|jgi:hypothetical protein